MAFVDPGPSPGSGSWAERVSHGMQMLSHTNKNVGQYDFDVSGGAESQLIYTFLFTSTLCCGKVRCFLNNFSYRLFTREKELTSEITVFLLLLFFFFF